jgi:uncharacterized Ntn-hydrolase superfamily protein
MVRRFLAPRQLTSTYSIVARDAKTGQLGVAVQSHWFSVGSVVCWAEPGVGAVATQSVVEPSYGPLGLAAMRDGQSAQEALDGTLAADAGRELRQVAMVDAAGNIATHTGGRCIAEAGHETGDGFSVQANMMRSSEVWSAMARAYRGTGGDFAEKLLAALEAGEAAGGDLRGKQSAAILIVAAERVVNPWEGVVFDLRVEDHPEPLAELRRLVVLQRAYEHMNRGDDFLGQGCVQEALQEYRTAAGMAPQIPELPFWQAVTLADLGRTDEALPIFRDVFRRDPNLSILVQRLPSAGLLREDRQMMERILSASR